MIREKKIEKKKKLEERSENSDKMKRNKARIFQGRNSSSRVMDVYIEYRFIYRQFTH